MSYFPTCHHYTRLLLGMTIELDGYAVPPPWPVCVVAASLTNGSDQVIQLAQYVSSG